LENVLEKVHRSLRTGGRLLNITPTHKPSHVSAEQGGMVLYSGLLYEPNFRSFLTNTELAVDAAVGRGLFTALATSLDSHVGEYPSVADWLADFLPLSEDVIELHVMEDALIAATASLSGEFVIKHGWEEIATLFKKEEEGDDQPD
jgi:hypothetical protein